MLTIQSYTKTPGILIFFDTKGIDELISYLDFLKNGNDSSMHLNTANELDEESQDDETHIIHAVKLINVDKLEEIE